MSAGKLQIIPYEPRWQGLWDEFVRCSRNGHFMLERGYMEYHADRFQDASLMFFDQDRLVALLPANRRGEDLVSHDGLPFAGFVAGPRTVHQDMVAVFESLRCLSREIGFRRLICTPAPACYHELPFEEDIYLLHRMGARCTGMKLSAGFAGPTPTLMSAQVRHSIRKAERKLPCEFFECHDVAAFWEHLEKFLWEHHAARPVHTAEEMVLLKCRFPDQIRMFFAKAGTEILGGTLVYLTRRVMRPQYSFRRQNDSTSVIRRLTLWLAAHPELSGRWIDHGTSNDPETGEIDASLFVSKEVTGARGTVVQTWTWDIPQ